MPLYATWNPSDKYSTVILYAANLGMQKGIDSPLSQGAVRSNRFRAHGKCYWEITIVDQGANTTGECMDVGVGNTSAALNNYIGTDAYGWGYTRGGQTYHNGSFQAFGVTYTTGDIISVALDLDNDKLWWAKNGVWLNSGDPATGANPVYTGILGNGDIYAMVSAKSSAGVIKMLANFGASAFTYSVPSGFQSGLYEEDAEASDALGLGDAATVFNLTDVVSDGIGLGDAATVFNLTDSLSDGLGLGDSVSGAETEWYPIAADATGFGDAATAYNLTDAVSDALGLGDAAAKMVESYHAAADALGLNDAATAFNWTVWLRQYEGLYHNLFYVTLTGAEDGTTDLSLSVTSIQARVRTGEPTYLQVVVAGVAQSAAISARSNGQIVVNMAFMVGTTEHFREEIARVDLETIRVDEGSISKSISLSGHRTKTQHGQIIALTDVTYRETSNGALRLRSAKVDPYARPGDTIQYDSEEFTAEMVSYTIGGDGQTSMEISEAD